MTYGLIGEHLGHSFSRIIHEHLTGEPYELRELARPELGGFLRSEPFRGINVTIPYKQAVIPYMDELAPSALLTGAVNAIVRSQDGRLTGHNTDFDGVLAMAAAAGVQFKGADVVILGEGGASKAVAAAARKEGARSVRFAVRREPFNAVRVPIADPSTFADCSVIVNATPVGMYPHDTDKPLDISVLPHLEGVLDCVYNPIRTELVLDAHQRGIPAAGGLMMLVAQAVRAAELFHSCTYPASAIESTYRFLLAGRRNIVLCGMPSCGKTTVGRALADRLGMSFTDTDDVVRTHSGMEIPDIFALEGEEGFRKRESLAIEAVSQEHGMVISTGGGAVLKGENVRALRRNGILFFLDRDPALLQPTEDRPLSRDRAALDRLYRQRLPLYLAAADARISNNGALSDTVQAIISYAQQG